MLTLGGKEREMKKEKPKERLKRKWGKRLPNAIRKKLRNFKEVIEANVPEKEKKAKPKNRKENN